MSIFTLSAISQNLPNTLPDTGFVGVGTNNPTCNFQVIGQIQKNIKEVIPNLFRNL
ncbi:MAG: hypothetical protein HUU48_01395 [Flavobacteriales bacterium]|nr:hypothetical protein [Flavobacteriales bacterium]